MAIGKMNMEGITVKELLDLLKEVDEDYVLASDDRLGMVDKIKYVYVDEGYLRLTSRVI